MPLSFDQFLSDSRFAADPFPFFRRLREEQPVQWSERWKCWILTRYDNVREVLQDARRFSNRGRITGLFQNLYSQEQLACLKALIAHYTHGLINDDPPDHTRMRRLLHAVFKPSVIQQLRERIQFLVDGLFDSLGTSQHMDFVRQFSHPLPVRVIAEVMGFPQSDTPRLIQWSHGIVEFQQHAAPPFEVTLRSQAALLELRDYLREAIAMRRGGNGEDVLSLMVRAESEGDTLSEEEILGTSVTLLNGGHETTTRLMATTVLDLCRYPAQKGKLRAHPELIDSAVEEFLRFSGPFQRDARVCKQTTEIGGKCIEAGQTLLLLLGAANRDPSQFSDAETLDITREPNKHLGFGYGPHICLGAPLARLETALAINTLLRRFPHYRLERSDLDWTFGFVWGPNEVPLILS